MQSTPQTFATTFATIFLSFYCENQFITSKFVGEESQPRLFERHFLGADNKTSFGLTFFLFNILPYLMLTAKS